MKTHRRFVSEDGAVVLVGTNAHGNDALCREAAQNDTWMHLRDEPSPHVIIKCPQQRPSRQTLQFGGMLCKHFSKRRLNRSATIIYTSAKNVRRTGTPGLVTLKGAAKHLTAYSFDHPLVEEREQEEREEPRGA